MKTLVVLSALVGLAIAAPAPHNGLQPNGAQQSNIHPNRGLHGLDTQGMHPIDFNSELNGPAASARSSNNPVIVKKKTGYHVYRDSTEERADADPNQKCGKQVRVKLCDEVSAKSTDLKRSTKTEGHATPKDDVEDSIKLAKEAVDSVQRDLKAIEHGTSGKTAAWKHGESDKDLHKDIEAARMALDHAQRNFGNLESMSLRAATIEDSRFFNDMHKPHQTDEQRMAQWKEAIKNIQRNVEIARNIEDSFKSAEPHTSFFNSEAIDTTKMMRSNENTAETHKTIKEETSLATSGRKAFEETSNKKTTETKSEHHIMTQKKAEEHMEHDMKTAASESVQTKHEHSKHMHANSKTNQGRLADISLNLKTPLALKAEADVKLTKDKGVNVETSLRNAHSEHKMSAHDKTMATNMHSQNEHMTKLNTEMSSRTSENGQHHFSAHKDESMKHTLESHTSHGNEHKTMQSAKTATKEFEVNISDKKLNQEKSAWAESENKDMLMKSAEHSASLMANMKHDHHKTQAMTENKSMKSAEHQHIEHNSDAEHLVQKSGLSAHSAPKVSDNLEAASETSHGPINLQLNAGVKLDAEKPLEGKSVEAKTLEMEHARVPYGHKGHHGGHHEGYHEGHHGHHGHVSHGYGYGHGHHGHHGHHGKAAEFDSAMHPSTQMDAKEFFEKAAMENMQQWKHHHDGARSAYGLGPYGSGLSLSGGSSAVGVFPHANVGGCGIPLLLSCSPSVVSGSLAKPHGYAAPAPAYRNEEESSFKHKRDILKTKETPIKKMKDVTKTMKPKNAEKML